MKRIYIGLALLYCTVLNVLHALLKKCDGGTKKDPLHHKRIGYISFLEKQNTANSVHLKHITLIKRKKKKFILSKKKRDANMLITVRPSQQEGENGLRMSSPPLCMLSQDCQDPSDGTNGQSGGSGKDGGGGEADAPSRGEPQRQLQPVSEALSPSSPGHDDGDDVEDDQHERKKKKKKRKESKGGSDNPAEEQSNHDGDEDVLNVDPSQYDEQLSKLTNSYLKKADTMDKKQLAGLDKEKMMQEYNRLVQILKESTQKKMAQYEGNEKKNIYELNERVINSSRKLNLEKMKREIEKSFTPNDALEKKIRDYMYVFTQSGGEETQRGRSPEGTTSSSTSNGSTTNGSTTSDSTPDGTSKGTAGDTNTPQGELLQEDEEKENREILKRVSRGDYSGVDKFHFKFSAKDLDRMKDIESTEEESAEERKIVDAAFDRIMKDNAVVKELRGKEEAFLQAYERGRRENKIERDEQIENLKYYNEMQKQRQGGGQGGNIGETTSGITPAERAGNTPPGELIDRKIFFNRVSSKFVDIKKEDIEEMSEAQVRDELRKRGYPTFGSIKEVRMRLQDVMRIRKNHEYDVRTILRNPEKHVLSHIRLDKLKETLKDFKENARYGDTESKIKQLDAAMEISNFVNDPVDYLRIDTTEKFAGIAEEHPYGAPPTSGGYPPEEEEEEDLSKVPIVNDCNISEQIAMAEKLRKNFTLEGDEKQPDQVIQYGSEEESESTFASPSLESQLQEQKEELCRREVLKYGGLQETVEEFHSKHGLPLDFIGDFICKVSSQTAHSINRYRKKRKEELEALEKNELELLISGHSINRNFIVYKFVDTNELISKYLTTKDIVTLIEYSNMADPVDVINFYSPETIFMLSEEYGITVDRVIDTCTRLNIRLPFGGDTHLNGDCFNVLTTHLARMRSEDKRIGTPRG
ncbi:Uncharacterized protein PCOAH_00053890 [Plasmodium coatneyi]|uniref:SAP domain-containing protein n=1 Tax=Plasmodium coatneyi TaxID=208452 RepID=A0A1B1E831_9APIC|nr:Uncharacterized protein PCOAH_00053890 [Plasmodium coatneyi]ANQ11148.1 Uncharacterized protein PCOAH_00053890 [Plasmodium coatneyi]